MRLDCDHCPRTASGSEVRLLDDGWVWIQDTKSELAGRTRGSIC